MNVREYKTDHPYCELIEYMPMQSGCRIVPLKPFIGFPVFGGRCRPDASDLHHVIGGDPVGRTDDPRNVLHLNAYVHRWVTDRSCAGRILSCWALHEKGCLDWEFLSRISRKCYPSIFETDKYLDAVREFPWLEPYRAQLIRRAA